MPSFPDKLNSVGRRRASVLLMLAFVCLPALVIGRGAGAAPGADWSRVIASRAQADLTAPTPLQTEVAAGPWRMTVIEVVTGDDATNQVRTASPANQHPPNGSAYVIARLNVTNAGSRPYSIDSDDFAVVDASGQVRRFTGAVAPEPALAGTVDPGATAEGWIVGGAPAGDGNLVLLYDSTSLTGDWADAAFALADGAAGPSAGDRAMAINETGRDPGIPADFATQVATDDWVIELLEVRSGGDVVGLYPAEDYRTTALIGTNTDVASTWIAFRVKVTNNRTGSEPAHFSETAFTLADGDGTPVPDQSTLTPPEPDLAAEYAPGASREGWIVFDAAGYDGALLRFQTFRTDRDPRYFTWNGSGAPAPSEPAFTGTLAPGTAVVTIEDLVRLRDRPSTDGEIVLEMPLGTKLTITGAPEEGSGFTWYPVENPESHETGYVAQQFIKPAGQ